jgi:hypothetical protein
MERWRRYSPSLSLSAHLASSGWLQIITYKYLPGIPSHTKSQHKRLIIIPQLKKTLWAGKETSIIEKKIAGLEFFRIFSFIFELFAVQEESRNFKFCSTTRITEKFGFFSELGENRFFTNSSCNPVILLVEKLPQKKY